MAYPVYQGTGGLAAVISGDLAITLPSGIATGDILIANVFRTDNDVPAAPTGWTEIQNQIGSASDYSYASYWRRAESAESGTVTFVTPSSFSGGFYGIIYRFDGCLATGTPYESLLTTGAPSNGTSIAITPTGPTGAERLGIVLGIVEDNTASSIAGTGWTQSSLLQTSVGADACLALATKNLNNGDSVGTVTLSSGYDYSSLTSLMLIIGIVTSPITSTTNGACTTSGVLGGKFLLSGVSKVKSTFEPNQSNEGSRSFYLGGYSKVGAILKNPVGLKIAYVDFLVNRSGSPTSSIYAFIHDVTIATGVTNDTILQSSPTVIPYTDITGTYQMVRFYFNGSIEYNSDIAIIVGVSDYTGTDPTNFYSLAYSNDTFGNLITPDYLGTSRITNWYYSLNENPILIIGFPDSVQGTLSSINIQPLVSSIDNICSTDGILLGKALLNGTSSSTSDIIAVLINGVTITHITTIVNGVATINAILKGRGIVQAVSNVALTVTGVLKARGYLIGVSNETITVIGVLKAKGKLIGVSNVSVSNSGLLNSNLKGSVIVNTTTNTSGVLKGKGRVLGVISTSSTNIGVIRSKRYAIGVINQTVTTQGILKGKGKIFGVSNEAISTSGTLKSKRFAVGIINNVASIQGILKAKGKLISVVNNTASTSGLLNSNLKGSVVVNTTTITIAVLTAKGKLTGLSNVLVSTIGVIRSKRFAIGQSNGQTTLTGVLTSDAIQGSSNSLSDILGVLIGHGKIIGVVNGIATIQGILFSEASVSGVSTGQTTTSSLLNGKGLLLGESNGVSSVSGSIFSKGTLAGTITTITTVNGSLIAKGLLAGISNGQTSTQGILISDAIAGLTNGTATTQGVLSAIGSLLGNSKGSSEGSALISITAYIEGVSDGSSILKADVVRNRIKGSSNASSEVIGTLSLNINIKCQTPIDYIDKIYQVKYISSINQVDYVGTLYPINYVNKGYSVEYLNKKYNVNYHCKKQAS